MIDNFLSKAVVMPLWALAALIFVLTLLVCRNTKPKWMPDSKALDFGLALIVAVIAIAAEYFFH
jgi:hypothetical protein